MKHLISSAIVVTCSLLAVRASAESPPPECNVPSSVATSVVADLTNVPTNAQLPFEWTTTCATANLETAAGVPIDTDVLTHRDGVLVLRPKGPLAPNTKHVVLFRARNVLKESISFETGGAEASTAARPAPVVEGLGVDWPGGESRGTTFRLLLKQPGAEMLGSWAVKDVTNGGGERGYLAKGEENLEIGFPVGQVNEGVETCFVASYVDATGVTGPASARTCVIPTNRPEPPPGSWSASDSDEGSCAVSAARPVGAGGTGSFVGIAAIGLAIGRRRRVR